MAEVTYFLNLPTNAARAAEVPLAHFSDGLNLGGSNAPGIGINIGGGAVVGTPEQFTLLDQAGTARTPQASQHIGGDGFTEATDWPGSGGVIGPGTLAIVSANPDAGGTGDTVDTGSATLATLAGGWTSVP